jgi:hypothetical protein
MPGLEKTIRYPLGTQMIIAKVTLQDSIADLVADGIAFGLPPENRLAMALAVIARAGSKFLQVGNERIKVE